MNYHLISLFFLIFFSIVFLYLDWKYQKIPNIISFFWIVFFLIFSFLSWFLQDYWLVFLFRTIILFFVFYFLYLQWRVAGGDFKLYFVISGFLLLFLYTTDSLKINWYYFDITIIFYSLVVGFFYLILRYLFLFVKKWFKLDIDPSIRYKISADRKDAILHFNIFIRSLIYAIFFIILEKYSHYSMQIYVFIVILEFTFMWITIAYIKDKVFSKLDWFVRKKEMKFIFLLVFFFISIYLIYLKYYSLVFLFIIFTFLEYILAVLQLNFDTKIVDVSNLKWNEKLSIRNFPINITKNFDLTNEIEIDEQTYEYIKNKKNVEIVTEVSYWIFLILWIYLFLYNNFVIISF